MAETAQQQIPHQSTQIWHTWYIHLSRNYSDCYCKSSSPPSLQHGRAAGQGGTQQPCRKAGRGVKKWELYNIMISITLCSHRTPAAVQLQQADSSWAQCSLMSTCDQTSDTFCKSTTQMSSIVFSVLMWYQNNLSGVLGSAVSGWGWIISLVESSRKKKARTSTWMKNVLIRLVSKVSKDL